MATKSAHVSRWLVKLIFNLLPTVTFCIPSNAPSSLDASTNVSSSCLAPSLTVCVA